MKYGVIVCRETANIGDDIQSYAASCLLPEVNYYIEREHLDVFRPNEPEPVTTIVNGWFMNNKLGWPLSGYINPLYISMHFLEEDSLLIADDFLKGIGAEDLIRHAPVGARDTSTMHLLEKNKIPCYFSGCLTLTLPQKFKKAVSKPYLCLTDIADEAVEFVRKQYPEFDIYVIAHESLENPMMVDKTADWKTRFRKVEELLELYQNATAVVTTRLHCAMPCLALNTPVLLLDDHSFIESERMTGLSDLVYSATTQDFINGNVAFDLRTPPQNPERYLPFRNKLIQTVKQFLKDNAECTAELEERMLSYDKNWEERALWKNSILLKLHHKHNEQWNRQHEYLEQVAQGKKWLEDQNKALTNALDAAKQWNTELLDSKQWLEQQNAAHIQELETTRQWSADLQEGKQWLEQQNSGLVQELEAAKQWNAELQEGKLWLENQNAGLVQEIAELRNWTEEQEKAKAYLLEQWQTEEKEHAKARATVDQMNDALMNQQNTIARQKYMLNLLLNDKWIQKVIQLRKIPVCE